jgi:hypothetical protein
MDAGLNLIICNGDISAMHAKLAGDITALRRAAGEAAPAGRKADDSQTV